ncbi:hypothetical protein BD410DRAFT_514541 [Rickenella mellea]|uniref:Uncharacterized protein n=1 Tax=Rickenella mellea TaxID=50990 RepID=A0A4Y7PRL0_9AGAM|nr:hypothetical protein BD410DRAFT_514541 [Rickenella mellea]
MMFLTRDWAGRRALRSWSGSELMSSLIKRTQRFERIEQLSTFHLTPSTGKQLYALPQVEFNPKSSSSSSALSDSVSTLRKATTAWTGYFNSSTDLKPWNVRQAVLPLLSIEEGSHNLNPIITALYQPSPSDWSSRTCNSPRSSHQNQRNVTFVKLYGFNSADIFEYLVPPPCHYTVRHPSFTSL